MPITNSSLFSVKLSCLCPLGTGSVVTGVMSAVLNRLMAEGVWVLFDPVAGQRGELCHWWSGKSELPAAADRAAPGLQAAILSDS